MHLFMLFFRDKINYILIFIEIIICLILDRLIFINLFPAQSREVLFHLGFVVLSLRLLSANVEVARTDGSSDKIRYPFAVFCRVRRFLVKKYRRSGRVACEM